jgi:hypothetical protein
MQVRVVHRIGHRERHALGLQRRKPRPHRRRALRHRAPLDQPAARGGELRLQHAHQVRVRHRRERVVAHGAVGEQHVAHEEVPLVDRAPRLRKGRRDEGDARAELRAQRLGHRADVARCGGIEGGADLEVHLLRPARAQPAAGRKRLRHRLGHRCGARFERYHHRVHLRGVHLRAGVFARVRARHSDRLHHAHARAHEVVGQVGGAGEIVGDAAEEHGESFCSGAGPGGGTGVEGARARLMEGRLCGGAERFASWPPRGPPPLPPGHPPTHPVGCAPRAHRD